MNNFKLFKNDFKRILTHKEVLVAAAIIVPLFIAAAILFSSKTNMVFSIAFVGDSTKNIPQSSKYKVEAVKERPSKTTLLMGKYSAIVERKNDGSYDVTTIKSKTDQKKIENFFNTGKMKEDKKRGIGTNILGYIFMIIIMQAVALTILYPEDRLKKTFCRILTAPVSERQYLFAQGSMTFICLFIPTYLAIIFINVCFRINVGFNPGMMAVLLAILSAFSTSFALFISSILDNNTSLVASSIAVITCTLGGCFKSFTKVGSLIDNIFNVIPQKDFMTLIAGVEKGRNMFDFKGQLAYLLVWIIALWFLGSIVTNKKKVAFI